MYNIISINIYPYLKCSLIYDHRVPEGDKVQISGRAFNLTSVEGADIFPSMDNKFNSAIIIIDPLKKHVTVLRNAIKSFW